MSVFIFKVTKALDNDYMSETKYSLNPGTWLEPVMANIKQPYHAMYIFVIDPTIARPHHISTWPFCPSPLGHFLLLVFIVMFNFTPDVVILIIFEVFHWLFMANNRALLSSSRFYIPCLMLLSIWSANIVLSHVIFHIAI